MVGEELVVFVVVPLVAAIISIHVSIPRCISVFCIEFIGRVGASEGKIGLSELGIVHFGLQK